METAEISQAKVLVQNRHTKAYLSGERGWNGSALFARPFETPYHALYFCVSHELQDADIVLRFPDAREMRFLRC